MSKSYGNMISPFDEGDELRAKVVAIKTRTVPFGEPLSTEDCAVLTLLELFGDEEAREFFTAGRRGSNPFGYGYAKQLLTEGIDEMFVDARERRRALTEDDVQRALVLGAWRASDVARNTLEACRAACRVG
jgi:tryptophanyl-tRNA synthetase